jgi:hypothetical protein
MICEGGLARETNDAIRQTERMDAIASKPAPTKKPAQKNGRSMSGHF